MFRSNATMRSLVRRAASVSLLGFGVLALLPGYASVIVTSNSSSLSVSTSVSSVYPSGAPPTTDSDSASLQFPPATPATFGDSIRVDSQLTFVAPPDGEPGASTHNISAYAIAGLASEFTESPGGITTVASTVLTSTRSQRGLINPTSVANMNADAVLGLILDLDRAYTYVFDPGHITFSEDTLGGNTAYATADLGGGFSAVYIPGGPLVLLSGSYTGTLAAGSYGFGLRSRQQMNQGPSSGNGAFVRWDAASLVLTPVAVPVPPAVWLFGSALGLMGVMRRKISS